MIRIRAASGSDLGTVRSLAHSIWPVVYGSLIRTEQIAYMLDKAYSIESLQCQLTEQKHKFILVEENQIALGFASFSEKKDNGKKTFRLHKLYLEPSQHGKGLGKLLVDYVIREAQKAGAECIELNVYRLNPTIGFYRKMGFIFNREVKEDIGNGFVVEDHVMVLPLSG